MALVAVSGSKVGQLWHCLPSCRAQQLIDVHVSATPETVLARGTCHTIDNKCIADPSLERGLKAGVREGRTLSAALHK